MHNAAPADAPPLGPVDDTSPCDAQTRMSRNTLPPDHAALIRRHRARLLDAISKDSEQLLHRALTKVYDPAKGLFVQLHEYDIRPGHARFAFDGALCAVANNKKIANVTVSEFELIAKACLLDEESITRLQECLETCRGAALMEAEPLHEVCVAVAKKSEFVFPYTVRSLVRIISGLSDNRQTSDNLADERSDRPSHSAI